MKSNKVTVNFGISFQPSLDVEKRPVKDGYSVLFAGMTLWD